ncbi:hypothetical protein JOD45_000756 [Scopulibacillus daqui]|uniref:YhzD-like protein n=1 Tax=Scopulibacillus daqui TaxID=1469162 RepID=A0ABS2PWX2_9BACL|nr:hypothetical protein [Scopulibacillus daqui]MBM7644563.1 hypothetical protein [Scopulibacillus daqui]
MKQYVFLFETDSDHPDRWNEVIESKHMFEAFDKAQQLSKKYEKEKSSLVNVEFKGVKYPHIA